MREASEQCRVFPVANALRSDAPRALIVGEKLVELLVKDVRFTVIYEEDQEQGLWSAYCPEIDVVGPGNSREEALDDVADAVIVAARAYLEDPAFYVKMGLGGQLPHILRIALAGEDRVKALLSED